MTATFRRVQRTPLRQSRTWALFGLASLGLSAAALAQTSEPLLQQSDLVYAGAFRVPQTSSDTATFNYGGTALGYNPANNSLYIVGHDWYQQSAEIKIPALVNSSDINSLNTATILQNFADATEGKLQQINPSDPNPQKIGGHLVYNGKLYVSAFSYYDGADTQKYSHFVRPLSLSTTGQVQGPMVVGSDPHFVDGYMTLIPSEWQTLLGGPALTGNCCQAITSIQSQGPSVTVFDPAALAAASTGATVAGTQVVGYPNGYQLGPGVSTQNTQFNLTTKITGVIFPPGTRSVLFFGRQGTGPYCYGTGADCNDPADSSKGTHAYPYQYQVWAYDANDLVSVKQGSKQRYAIQPYAIWSFTLPFEGSGGMNLIGGAAYDASTGTIYVSQMSTDTNSSPVIHAFKVPKATTSSSSTSTTTPTVPDPPTSVTVQ
ncbi:MAG TPA: hypothetical protein VHB68_17655 [Steroidobacteraceae bacterium]|nr:hypothetical protein [Steroidobacteraceae bacterium]